MKEILGTAQSVGCTVDGNCLSTKNDGASIAFVKYSESCIIFRYGSS